MSYLAHSVLAVVFALAVGIGVYVGGSFLLMRAHTEPRLLRAHVREAWREITCAVVTQSILPLWYLLGRRMEWGRGVEPDRPGAQPVVFVHGYAQNRVDFVWLARALEKAGLGPLYGFNYPWFGTIRANAARLRRFIERVRKETGKNSVDLVCHSLGGLVAMEFLAGRESGKPLAVRRCVTIASPHAGVVFKGPILAASGEDMRCGSPLLLAHASARLPMPCLSIYSTHDNVVHPVKTSSLVARGGRDVVVDHVGHLAILFSRSVAVATVEFLRESDDPVEYAPALMTTAEAESVKSEGSPVFATPVFAMKSPIDGAELAPVAATLRSEIAAIVGRAREAQRAWAAVDVDKRAKTVAKVKHRVLERADEIAKLIHREVGKPEVEALLGEVLASADVVTYWTESIQELLESSEVELDRMTFPGKSGVIHREARGVVGLISPWNFPVGLPLRTIIPALLAGNAVVFKPSEVSPRSGALIAELFEGILPKDLFAIVQGAGDIGAALCEADVDVVAFTGSVASGRKVAHACAERLIPCALELGGKDAAIVLADANLDRAANGVVWGALMNAGQNCAAIERVYVEKPVAEEFTKKVVAAVKALSASDVGPLTTSAQRDTVLGHVTAAGPGATVLAGGKKGEKGYAFEPTVISIEKDDVPLMQDETFGPVLPIRVVADAEEAIRLANASRYGLTASIWTKKVRRGEAMAHRLKAGVVTINNHSFTGALPQAPWSGHGETGWGITNSPLALESLTRPRFVLVDKSGGKSELWWYPYTPTLKAIALAFAVLRGGGGIFGRVRALFTLLGALPKRLMGRDRLATSTSTSTSPSTSPPSKPPPQ